MKVALRVKRLDSTALMSRMSVQWQRDAFSSPALKRSDSTAGSRNESGSEFQTVGPATEKARVPNVLLRNRGMFSLRRLAERRRWRAGNFGDWHAAVGEVLWSSVPKTPVKSRQAFSASAVE